MDTTPIYELRARLRAAGIAGTSLLSEDFRLKRAYEAFKPLEAASPVFAKLGQLTTQLLAPDCPNLQKCIVGYDNACRRCDLHTGNSGYKRGSCGS